MPDKTRTAPGGESGGPVARWLATEPIVAPESARKCWAKRLIDAAPGAPKYGCREWLALPEGSPAKVSSTVRAAEAWACDGDDLERRLRVEVLALSRANKQAEDAEYLAACEQWRQTWAGGVHHPDPDLPAQLEAEFSAWAWGAA